MSGGHKCLTEQVQELKTNRGEEVESLSIFREVRLCRKGKKFGWRGLGAQCSPLPSCLPGSHCEPHYRHADYFASSLRTFMLRHSQCLVLCSNHSRHWRKAWVVELSHKSPRRHPSCSDCCPLGYPHLPCLGQSRRDLCVAPTSLGSSHPHCV